MRELEYRTAKALLTKHGFATFRTTNKGTIGKLVDMLTLGRIGNKQAKKALAETNLFLSQL